MQFPLAKARSPSVFAPGVLGATKMALPSPPLPATTSMLLIDWQPVLVLVRHRLRSAVWLVGVEADGHSSNSSLAPAADEGAGPDETMRHHAHMIVRFHFIAGARAGGQPASQLGCCQEGGQDGWGGAQHESGRGPQFELKSIRASRANKSIRFVAHKS